MEHNINNHNNAKPNGLIQAAQSDFKTSLILLAIAFGLLIHTLSFPMSGSFGGVENQWFVSPALFPLIVCSLLALCSALLLFKSIKQQGFTGFMHVKTWIGDWQENRIKDRWYIIWLLLVFVYVYIPSIDFYIAAVLFLASLTHRFYYESKHALGRITFIHLILATVLVAIKLNIHTFDETTWLTVNQDQQVINYSDATASIAVLLLLALNWLNPTKRNIKKACIQTAVVLMTPLILIIIFTFLLFVPMPVEYGMVSNFLSYIAYDVLAAQ